MDATIDSLVEAIHGSGFHAALVVAGGGSRAVDALLAHPGASRFVLEAQIPYSPEAMYDYLGEKLEQACSAEAAAVMAGRAYERAYLFSLTRGAQLPVVGIACTAALHTTRERKGEDRAFVCIKSRRQEVARRIELPVGGRAVQEQALSNALLDLIAEFVGVHERAAPPTAPCTTN